MSKDFKSGERVVLGQKGTTSMVRVKRSGDELAVSACPGFAGLLDSYEAGDFTIDND